MQEFEQKPSTPVTDQEAAELLRRLQDRQSRPTTDAIAEATGLPLSVVEQELALLRAQQPPVVETAAWRSEEIIIRRNAKSPDANVMAAIAFGIIFLFMGMFVYVLCRTQASVSADRSSEPPTSVQTKGVLPPELSRATR